MGYVIYNGELTSAAELTITPQNRAFRYGDGFFETIRCRSGFPLWIDDHFERVVKSASALSMELAPGFDAPHFSILITRLLQSNGHIGGARVRASFFRQDGGLYKPGGNQAHLLIESAELAGENFNLNRNGLIMGFYPDIRKPFNAISHLKTSSALLYVLASCYGQEKGWDDVIIINTEGFIAEVSSSNLFMVEGGKIFTPSLDQGCVEGVMRRVILDMGVQYHYKVTECAIQPDDLQNADEVFISNAVSGIQWVKGIGLKRYYHVVASQLTDYLEERSKIYLEEKKL
jgi:branched-chain amino acid aminotransferase